MLCGALANGGCVVELNIAFSFKLTRAAVTFVGFPGSSVFPVSLIIVGLLICGPSWEESAAVLSYCWQRQNLSDRAFWSSHPAIIIDLTT